MAGIKTDSPFTPGQPAPVDSFVGRQPQLEECVRYLRQAVAGRPESIFLSGPRGSGKTSLAGYLRHYAERVEGLLGVYVHLGGVSNLGELVGRIYQSVVNASAHESWSQELLGYFGKHLERASGFGVSWRFAAPEPALSQLVGLFPQMLHDLVEILRTRRSGLFLVLDDLSGVARDPAFADWYKGFVDAAATLWPQFHAALLLVGLPEERLGLYDLQPSLPRVFRPVSLGPLTDGEVAQFFTQAFATKRVTVADEALPVLCAASRGQALVMQELGDATWWLDRDDHIDLRDAQAGVAAAAERIEQKYLHPRVTSALANVRYQPVLLELAGRLGEHFTRAEVFNLLTADQRALADSFLRRLRELEVIEGCRDAGAGGYRFTHPLYPVYLALRSTSGR